ncbi:MAG TPA: glycosyltransferase [Opitutaceae bacterium]|nr:glycosyltransferase [Opitutaceae bacterium]
MTTVSILTTVRNGEAFIRDALLSAMRQDFAAVEHIVVNDGSEDSTASVVDVVSQAHPAAGIRLMETKRRGRGAALQFGVAQCRGDWIGILDADDIWHPKKLRRQMDVIGHNANIDMIGTETALFGPSVVDTGEPGMGGVRRITVKELLKHNPVAHSSVLIRRQLCRYDMRRKSQLDYELWLRLATEGRAICLLQEKLTYHRIHAGQHFERLQGKSYVWRSVALQGKYGWKHGSPVAFVYIMARLIYHMILPRALRMRWRPGHKTQSPG